MSLRKIFLFTIFFVFCGLHTSLKAQSSEYKDASDELIIPTEEQLFKDDPDPVVLSAQIAVRLKKIQQIIPLDYNEHVQKYITYNTADKRREHIEKMLGRAKKFFPIFEPILAKYGIPDEMKYLAVIESALNPFALSRVGASGPWQFMYSTALRYNLNISKKIDERRDPYLACDAAARYLKEMHDLYGNWQLAIASYNCGAGNVNRAIQKAGGSMNFWDIRPYLPAETRAYVPIFIAMVYTMKYADKYAISPLIVERENTQRVTAKQKFSINDLQQFLEIPKQIIIDENPSLLSTIIPEDYILNLPESKIQMFNKLQDSIAEQQLLAATATLQTNNSVDSNESKKEEKFTPSNSTKNEWKTIPIINENKRVQISSANSSKEDDVNYKNIAYTVKKNDNLGKIANWFHCNVKEIREWNNLPDNNINLNDELLIYVHKNDYKKFVRFNYLSSSIKDELSSKITTQEELNEKSKLKVQKENTPLIDKINPIKILSKKNCFKTHVIKNGETLYGIAQKYDDVTVQDLLQWNGFKKAPILHQGDIIKVRKIACK